MRRTIWKSWLKPAPNNGQSSADISADNLHIVRRYSERFADNGRQNANPETVRVYSLVSICVSISIEMENKSQCLRTN